VARRARLLFAGVPQHIIQRGNNRQATFFAEERIEMRDPSARTGSTCPFRNAE
jgi:REP element-mobilizing transposase RayT